MADSAMFEIVYTCTDWYDGPRAGIANYCGQPHLFASEWADGRELDSDTFLLSPAPMDVFELALEDWQIWRRWETAFHLGQINPDTHPALPEDLRRHEELTNLLEGRLLVDEAATIRKRADFQVRVDSTWSGQGFRPLEVLWSDPV